LSAGWRQVIGRSAELMLMPLLHSDFSLLTSHA
jgi:hypothetical protein